VRSGRAPEPLIECLAHRGPDGSGIWRSPNGRCVLGHTRLAILDPSEAGAQPMVDPATGSVLVFNGEIYNHPVLRAELDREDAVAWRGTSDTETLLAGYLRWGRELLNRMRGMYAFALYDGRDGSLLLARDRMGIKPLYYLVEDTGVRFGSELKVVAEDRAIEPETVAEFLRWGCVPDEAVFPGGCEMIPAGGWIRISDGEIVERGQSERWRPETEKAHRLEADATLAVRRLLEDAVEEHLLSDVPVASFLSGGIDSSVVTALAARRMGARLRTFSVGFPDREWDETRVADEVARACGTEHTRIEVGDNEARMLVREAVERMDCPSIDAINSYVVSKKVAERGIKVALSGLGGDELFGGYPAFRDVPRLMALARMPRLLRWAACRISGADWERISDLPEPDAAALARWRRVVFADAALRRAGLPVHPIAALPAPPSVDAFAAISRQELAGYTRPMLLRDADQMSMAVSLEVRVPLLDNRLVEYIISLPEAVKRVGPGTKGLLVRACADVLPEAVWNRPKMGFSLPMDRWMRGPLKGFCEERIDALKAGGLVRPEFVERVRREFDARKLHWSRLWALVVL
jgi:asparagine synthase (glutamine-hydrolysing)